MRVVTDVIPKKRRHHIKWASVFLLELRLGDVQKIPLATNVNSATIMLEALKNETFFHRVPVWMTTNNNFLDSAFISCFVLSRRISQMDYFTFLL